MTTILVVYHSQTGNTRQMAQAVVRGIDSVGTVTSILKPAHLATLDDLLTCSGLAIGSPEYFGYMAGQIKDFFDRTYYPARQSKKIFKKPYVAFISAGNDGTGSLLSIERIALGYPLKKVFEPVVAKGGITNEVLSRCEELGMTIAAGCDAKIY
ncbi:MAG: flavodoxin family protein [Desulfotignum sp.]